MNYRIITYEEKYRDDLIFMVLEAKNALAKCRQSTPICLVFSKLILTRAICSGLK